MTMTITTMTMLRIPTIMTVILDVVLNVVKSTIVNLVSMLMAITTTTTTMIITMTTTTMTTMTMTTMTITTMTVGTVVHGNDKTGNDNKDNDNNDNDNKQCNNYVVDVLNVVNVVVHADVDVVVNLLKSRMVVVVSFVDDVAVVKSRKHVVNAFFNGMSKYSGMMSRRNSLCIRSCLFL